MNRGSAFNRINCNLLKGPDCFLKSEFESIHKVALIRKIINYFILLENCYKVFLWIDHYFINLFLGVIIELGIFWNFWKNRISHTFFLLLKIIIVFSLRKHTKYIFWNNAPICKIFYRLWQSELMIF